MFARLLAGFAGVAIPAAVVNAGLKYCQKLIQLAFMRRLTHHLHRGYCSHRAYYAASTLGGMMGSAPGISFTSIHDPARGQIKMIATRVYSGIGVPVRPWRRRETMFWR